MKPRRNSSPDRKAGAPGTTGESRARRFGAFVTGGHVDRVRELQAGLESEETEKPETPTAEHTESPLPLATQGVIAEMHRHLERQGRTTPRTA